MFAKKRDLPIIVRCLLPSHGSRGAQIWTTMSCFDSAAFAVITVSLHCYNTTYIKCNCFTHFRLIIYFLTSVFIVFSFIFQIINYSSCTMDIESLPDAAKQRLMKTGYALKCALWLLTGHVLPTLISSRSNYARHKNLLSSAISAFAFHSVWASFAAFMRGQNAAPQSPAAAVFHNVISLPRNNGSCPEVCVMKAKPDCDWQRRPRCIKPGDAWSR